MKTLYLECASGVSGDMAVAALLDLGADPEALRRGLDSLAVSGYRLEISRIKKSGIDACDFTVRLDSEDSDSHHHGDHAHRNLSDILAIIEASGISARAKQTASDIFRVVAEAEAAVHNLPVEEVHFHEVGAVDSIVDIVAAAICLDLLGVEQVICSPLSEGVGTIVCQHGVIPVPAPATLEIVRKHNIPLRITGNEGEMVTPTGAAIVAATASRFGHPDSLRVSAIGYGAGKRNYPTANTLRAMLLDEGEASAEQVLELSCNLDDMTGEHLGYAMEKLLEEGALDVWHTPVLMKKSRPGDVLSLLCRPEDEERMTLLLMEHTSTIGVRVRELRRHVMERSFRRVETPWGTLGVKDCVYKGIKKSSIEYEDAREIAHTCKIPIDQLYRSAYNRMVDEGGQDR